MRLCPHPPGTGLLWRNSISSPQPNFSTLVRSARGTWGCFQARGRPCTGGGKLNLQTTLFFRSVIVFVLEEELSRIGECEGGSAKSLLIYFGRQVQNIAARLYQQQMCWYVSRNQRQQQQQQQRMQLNIHSQLYQVRDTYQQTVPLRIINPV